MKSIMQEDTEHCYLCGRRLAYREEHHIFGGPNRKLSEKHGLKVFLCTKCHRDNKEGVHGNAEKMRLLHEAGQQAFVVRFPDKDFREIFGKNYIDKPKMEEVPVNTGGSGFLWLKGEGDEQSDFDGPPDT